MYQDNGVVDFVIPLHRYHNMVRTVIEALHTFYNPRVIYIITPLNYVDEINTMSSNWNKNTIIALPEETFFMKNYGLSIDDIKQLFNNENDERSREFGWWYQQIIKLGAQKQIKGLSDPFVVWDSDLVPIIKWDIYPTKENPYYRFALLQEQARSEWNIEQYKNSLNALAGIKMIVPDEGTFVPHHFVFHHNIINDLLSYIELYECKLTENPTWIHSIMSLSHTYFRFSEYITLASFMDKFYPDLLQYHKFSAFGKYGYRIRESKYFVKEIEEKCKIDSFGLSYIEFCNFVKKKYDNLPSYLQIEHI
uniref:Uncharacterized protein n=1 Tax=viral metagenome TaxID=1070528 RepID=A0A6C0EA42_9ZZZZ